MKTQIYISFVLFSFCLFVFQIDNLDWRSTAILSTGGARLPTNKKRLSIEAARKHGAKPISEWGQKSRVFRGTTSKASVHANTKDSFVLSSLTALIADGDKQSMDLLAFDTKVRAGEAITVKDLDEHAVTCTSLHETAKAAQKKNGGITTLFAC